MRSYLVAGRSNEARALCILRMTRQGWSPGLEPAGSAPGGGGRGWWGRAGKVMQDIPRTAVTFWRGPELVEQSQAIAALGAVGHASR